MRRGMPERRAPARLPGHGGDEPLPEGNWPIIAASPIPYFPYSQVPREMDRRDLDAVRGDFVRAAQMGGGAGFGVLVIPFARGYLFVRFFSPRTYLRVSEWGGGSA